MAAMEHATILRTETVPIHSVTQHPENARRGDTKRIEASLRRFGQYAPIVVHEQSGFILKGNHTHRVMSQKLGLTEINVTFVSCSEHQARAILAADNRTSDGAGYDEMALLQLLETLESQGDLAATGYVQADIDELTQLLQEPVEEPDESDERDLIEVKREDGAAPAIHTGEGAGEPGLADRARDYDKHPTRGFHFVLPLARYTWATELLDELAAEYKVDNHADTLLRMINELTSHEIPDA